MLLTRAMLAAHASRRAGRAQPRGSPTATRSRRRARRRAAGRTFPSRSGSTAAARSRRRFAGTRRARRRPRTRGCSSSSRARPRRRATAASRISGASTSAAVTATSTATTSAIARSGRSRLPTTSDQRPAPMRPATPSACTTASTPAAAPGRESAVVVEKEHREPEHAVLGREDECAAGRDPPEARVAEWLHELLVARRSRDRSLTEHETADGGRDEAGTAHRREAEAGATVMDEWRQGERRSEAADRDRRLADAERDPALPRREPRHHGTPARGLDARPGEAGQHQQAAAAARMSRHARRRPGLRHSRRRPRRAPPARRSGRSRDPTGRGSTPTRPARRR